MGFSVMLSGAKFWYLPNTGDLTVQSNVSYLYPATKGPAPIHYAQTQQVEQKFNIFTCSLVYYICNKLSSFMI